MKPLNVTEDIYPLGEFRTHASEVIKKLRESQRAVVITQHGKPAAVLITPQAFDRFRERERFVESVERGLADAAAGRMIGDDEMGRLLKKEFGSRGKG
jgi:prevent-host-death family protein